MSDPDLPDYLCDPNEWHLPEDFGCGALIELDTAVVSMVSLGDQLRIVTKSGREYIFHRMPGTPQGGYHA